MNGGDLDEAMLALAEVRASVAQALARLERAKKALEFYAKKGKWTMVEATSKIRFEGVEVDEGEPFMAFSDGDTHPWLVASEALKDYAAETKVHRAYYRQVIEGLKEL